MHVFTSIPEYAFIACNLRAKPLNDWINIDAAKEVQSLEAADSRVGTTTNGASSAFTRRSSCDVDV